jgi:hypothetical protein
MAKNSTNPPKPQIEKFRDLARQLETDDDEARFDERLKRLTKTPHRPKPEGNSDRNA